jgi:histidine ammonia-lyase
VAENVNQILALEALGGAQGIDLLKPLEPGHGVARALASVRAQVPFLEEDRPFYQEMEVVAGLVRQGELARVAESVQPASAVR